MVIYVNIHILRFDHRPELFVVSGCIGHEEDYWLWYRVVVACCFFTLFYGVIGAAVECAIIKISGMGTPTETHARRHLVPLCKCNLVPMLIVRIAGFIFAVVSLALTEQYCKCAVNNMPEEWLKLESLIDRKTGIFSACPTDSRTWYVAARILIFTMGCDAIFPLITFTVVMRKKIHRWYRRIRPLKERELEDVQRSWQIKCKRFCECSSLMTCYMCGGHKLTAGSYADVAIALTDFLDDGGSLDIVPSDIAAALICLVSIQKQKQISAKEELLKEGGLFAKDRRMATRLWRQLFNGTSDTNGRVKKKPEHKREISAVLQNSVIMGMSSANIGALLNAPPKNDSMSSMNNSEDIETGLNAQYGDNANSTELVIQSTSLDNDVLSIEEGEFKF